MTLPTDVLNIEAKVNVDDKMDEVHLMRLATGLTVDATAPSSGTVSFLHLLVSRVLMRPTSADL